MPSFVKALSFSFLASCCVPTNCHKLSACSPLFTKRACPPIVTSSLFLLPGSLLSVQLAASFTLTVHATCLIHTAVFFHLSIFLSQVFCLASRVHSARHAHQLSQVLSFSFLASFYLFPCSLRASPLHKVFAYGHAFHGALGLASERVPSTGVVPEPALVTALADREVLSVCCSGGRSACVDVQGQCFEWGSGVGSIPKAIALEGYAPKQHQQRRRTKTTVSISHSVPPTPR
jgi:hypothetical protein